jgi:hypothetical protein
VNAPADIAPAATGRFEGELPFCDDPSSVNANIQDRPGHLEDFTGVDTYFGEPGTKRPTAHASDSNAQREKRESAAM